jgi:heptaprenyl diphosphate synthase
MDAVFSELKTGVRAAGRAPGIEGALAAVEAGIRGAIGGCDGVVRDLCTHIAASGGKRMRPQLVLRSGLLFSRINARMLGAAVAAELIHMASLIHDDVIDRSALRRGRPSANSLWGCHAAVLCGDWLFARAFGILSGRGLAGCLALMSEAIGVMCRGEILQAGNIRNLDIGLDEYYAQISAKTARLLECCCRCGALAAGADASAQRALGEFGQNLGMAFQITDDILDLAGDPRLMGKPAGEDLRQGVATLPVILLLRHAGYGAQARDRITSARFSPEDMAALNAMLDASGAIEEARGIASAFIDAAKRSLAGLPDSESKAFLLELASSLGQRDK